VGVRGFNFKGVRGFTSISSREAREKWISDKAERRRKAILKQRSGLAAKAARRERAAEEEEERM
jgi:hypothetical protein